MKILDTREASREHAFALILDDGTSEGEKVTFTIKPLTLDVYMKIRENQQKLMALDGKPSKKAMQESQKIIDSAVIPLVEPADRFTEFLDTTTPFTRRIVLDNVEALAIPNKLVSEE